MEGIENLYVCPECNFEWIKGENGLLPEFCIRNRRWYGVWRRNGLFISPVDCPCCHDENWIFIDLVEANVG